MENIVIATQGHALRFQMERLFGFTSKLIVSDSEDKVFETDDMDTLSEGVDVTLSDGSLLNLKYGRNLEATLNGKPVPVEREIHWNRLNDIVRKGTFGIVILALFVLLPVLFGGLCDTTGEYVYILIFVFIEAGGAVALYSRKVWAMLLFSVVSLAFIVFSTVSINSHPMYMMGNILLFALIQIGTALYHMRWLRRAENG